MKNTQFHKIALTAALLASAGFASAQTAATTTGTNASAMSGTTRIEQKNEAKMAEREGSGTSSGTASSGKGRDMAHASTKGSDTSRAAVKRKAKKAAHSNKGTSLGEASVAGATSVHAAPQGSPGLRMEKHAEGKAAAKNAPGNEGTVDSKNGK